MPSIMIAEDDLLMADMLEEVLTANGYEVCGIARTVDHAVELSNRFHPDLAILDLRLADGGIGTEIVPRMHRTSDQRPGILYATGNGTQIPLTRRDGEACLAKPYRSQDILQALSIVEQVVNAETALQPFPKGFHLLNGAPKGLAAPPARGDPVFLIQRLRRQQADLARFGSFALGETDLGKILTEAARICADSLGVPFAKICRFRTSENDLLVEAGVGWRPGVIGCAVCRPDESSPQGRAFTTCEPVICNDLSGDFSYVLSSIYAEHGIVSTIDVVIKRTGVPYGVLGIGSTSREEYDEHDVMFLTGFANVIAEAVDTSKRNSALLSAVLRMQDMIADKDRLLAVQKTLIDENSILAQEVQHRVRNNLQLVNAMLSRQIEDTTDQAGKEGMEAISRRVMTLAQVYDHLLRAGLTRTIDFGKYMSSLCASIEALQAPHPGVSLDCQWEPVFLDLDTVTALGLIVSELISNSFRHAYPAGGGAVSISLTVSHSSSEATIIFKDDGIGFVPVGVTKRRGLGLVRRLMEQIGGTATLGEEHGTQWTLRFPLPKTEALEIAPQ